MQSTTQLNVTSSTGPPTGHYIHITINGTVSITGNSLGTHNNWNWPHFCGGNGQSNSGVEANKTTVYCGGDCSADGASHIECDYMNNVPQMTTSPECTDETLMQFPYNTTYNAPFTGAGPYDLQIDINVTAPAPPLSTSSAYLYSLGTHIEP